MRDFQEQQKKDQLENSQLQRRLEESRNELAKVKEMAERQRKADQTEIRRLQQTLSAVCQTSSSNRDRSTESALFSASQEQHATTNSSASREVTLLKESFSIIKAERDSLLNKLKNLEEQKDLDRTKIANLEEKCRKTEQELRQLLWVTPKLEEYQASEFGLQSNASAPIYSTPGAALAAPNGEKKKVGAKPKTRWLLKEDDTDYTAGVSLNDAINNLDFAEDDSYVEGEELDDHDVWKRKNGDRKPAPRKQPRLEENNDATKHRKLAAAKSTSSIPKVSNYLYRCPVKMCTYCLEFSDKEHPPLKNGTIADDQPWPEPFRGHAFVMREHIEDNHPSFMHDLWPVGIRQLDGEDDSPYEDLV